MKTTLLIILLFLSFCSHAQTVNWSLNGVHFDIEWKVTKENAVNRIEETVVINNKSDKDIYIPTSRGMYTLSGTKLIQKIGVLYKDIKNMGPDSGYLVLRLLKAGEKITFKMDCVTEQLQEDVELIIAADFLFADKVGHNGLLPIDNITVEGKKFPDKPEEQLFRMEKYKPEAVFLVQSIKLNLFNQIVK